MLVNISRIWKISPGDRGRQWPKWLERGVAAIGFSMEGNVGDVFQYKSLDALISFHESYNSALPKYYAKQLWQFTHSVKEGDILVAYKLYGILDIGIVTGPVRFEYDELARMNEIFCYRRPVQWMGFEYRKLNSKSAKKHMSRNMTIFMIFEEESLFQIRDMLQSCEENEFIECSRGIIDDSPVASDLAKPKRVKTTSYRILRDTAKCGKMKDIHNHRCQICGERIIVPGKGPYSEAHHIRPLGGKHKGPDTYSNMLCLCPIHHAEMDLGVFYVDPEKLDVIHSSEENKYHRTTLRTDKRHNIDSKFLVYHKEKICSDWIS